MDPNAQLASQQMHTIEPSAADDAAVRAEFRRQVSENFVMVQKDLSTGLDVMSSLREDIAANTVTTREIKAILDAAKEALAAMSAFASFMRRIAKYLIPFAVLGSAIAAMWASLKGGPPDIGPR